ncbi:DUF2157 domain-containing protein [Calothrix sp. 336/3]|uniref:DUF2157 domain-containing protein n=1 Tax=Calothrix sp. 336/3 TaxID=1337936 RepID=UPI0004E3B187|nr:DUF2157 domain-containing protein [Calothrix sp. 336/3]AKG20816.1 hypothetical protein IJ00_05385 [Calothrix sp. 336/3]
MSSSQKDSFNLNIRLPSTHPELLRGLDIWLRMGLISNAQVRQICREYLTCRVNLEAQAVGESVAKASEEAEESAEILAPVIPKKPKQPSRLAGIFQSLISELSVRWLLFLGMFLVVVSSGVLAASQWERFPASGQYGVLLAYTLSFFGLSFWAGRQENLRLTAQALLLVSLLLVPVNFWAIDSFGLWFNLGDGIIAAIALIILTAITVILFQNRLFSTSLPQEKLRLVNILGLSYLHWGWKVAGFPLVALYIAMIGTCLLTIYQTLYGNQENIRNRFGINLPLAVIIYSLLLLLTRGIFVARLDITQLGLAIGICGWLVTWLVQQKQQTTETPSPLSFAFPWELLGATLLFIGWLVSVISQPWQAFAVSGLGLYYLYQRLELHSRRRDFLGFFIVGLQMMFLAWRLVPPPWQVSILTTATRLTQSPSIALLSIALFPYVIAIALFTEKLYLHEKRQLGKFSQQVNLAFGVCLTAISLLNPCVRSLNLLLSTLTLFTIYRRRSGNRLIYLIHTTAILTIFSLIDWRFPNLENHLWASIFVLFMVVELLASLGEGVWRRSAWYIGLSLAGLSFLVLSTNAENLWLGNKVNYGAWSLIWLATPITLTAVASRATIPQRNLATAFSIISLGAIQLLTLPLFPGRLISLLVATVVMFVNTRYLTYTISAVITVAFLLASVASILWQIPGLTIATWCVFGAIATLILWFTHKQLRRREGELSNIYAFACDQWAIALTLGELLALTFHSVLLYQKLAAPDILYLTTTFIILGGIIYRSWGETNNYGFYAIGWSLELISAQMLGFGERTLMRVAIANIALGLITQILGEWWQRKHNLDRVPSSFHILPILYASLSVILRLDTFQSWTGFCSLGVACILVGVGRRRQELKPLLYLGIIGISLSLYELLFYQMAQSQGGAWGDGLIAMAALGVGILYIYQIFAPWLSQYLRLTILEIRAIAYFHWVWSSCLLIAAIAAPIAINRYLAIATGLLLARYAIFQGRANNYTNHTEIAFSTIPATALWVYLGFIETIIISIYAQETALGNFIYRQLQPWNAALSCIPAYLLYILPWENWGWLKKPWQHIAYILPVLTLILTWQQVNSIALLLTAGFYLFLAYTNTNIRLSYVSITLLDWALWRWFNNLNLTDNLWYVSLIGLSILYIAQIDPTLQQPEKKIHRHYLRSLGSGLICGCSLIFHLDTPLIPGILSLIFIFAGLALRIRAYLFLGTATFLITSIHQMVIFSLRYPFFKWIIGLILGIILISIAANFENRRSQINSLLRNTQNEFQEWE